MKKIALLFMVIVIAWAVCLVGCTEDTGDLPDGWVTEPYPTGPYPTDPFPEIPETTPDTEEDTPVPEVVEIVDIVDLTENGDIVTADALEGFYSDEYYNYYFPSIKSQYVIVHYSDGTTQPAKEALGEGRITITDLDRFGIGYYKEERVRPVYVIQVIDRTVTDGIPTDDALEKFWEDEYSMYYFPSIKSEYVIVQCSNDMIYTIREALEMGLLGVDQLKLYNIDYITVDKPAVKTPMPIANITDWSVEYGIETAEMEEVFYEDETYRYIFSSLKSEYIVVIYEAGWQENVKDALTSGRATIEDLDRFGISYYKESKDDSGKSTLVNIIDLTAVTDCEYSTAGQKFYADDEYEYFFMNWIKDLVIAVYEDGSTEPVWLALSAGRATIEDLDRFGIDYYTESNQYKGTTGVKVIYDRVASGELKNDFGGGMYDDTYDTIYEDDKYWYVLHTPYEAAVVVIYADDTMESVGNALAAGRISIDDLDKWDIGYDKYSKDNRVANEVKYEMLGDMAFIWNSEYTPQDIFDYSTKESSSLYGDMSVFTDYDSYAAFVSEINEKLVFDESIYYITSNTITFEGLTAPYNAEWFNENALIFIHFSQGHYNTGNVITSVTVEEGKLLTVSLDTLNFGADVGVDWFVCVGVSKADIPNSPRYRLYITENNTAIDGKYTK
ncbi:MAG: hypothetical protein E7627_02490 [Ruminococcaceae bacterium]|nr:hypothetical protein [Oscillospiraceae bacterium]